MKSITFRISEKMLNELSFMKNEILLIDFLDKYILKFINNELKFIDEICKTKMWLNILRDKNIYYINYNQRWNIKITENNYSHIRKLGAVLRTLLLENFLGKHNFKDLND